MQTRGMVRYEAKGNRRRQQLPERSGDARGATGKVRHEATSAAELPAVGDWVAVHLQHESPAIIRAVLPRKSKFTRKAAWIETEEQVLAANVDVVLLINGLDDDLNIRRIERYMTMAWASGAAPSIVLNKADLCDDVSEKRRAVETVASGVPIHVVSGVSGQGIDEFRSYLQDNLTGTLLGSSGVGKSTITNRLCEAEVLKTAPIRWDGRGRHTTTHRELVLVPSGGLLIDTPGMRELQLWDPGAGLEEAFEDIDAIAAGCKFRDCEHDREPGCEGRMAVDSGELDPARLASWQKLKRELRHLELRRDARARADERKKYRTMNKSIRAKYQTNGKKGRR